MFPMFPNQQQPWLRHKNSDVEHLVSNDPVIVRQEDLQPAGEPVEIEGDIERVSVRWLGREIGSYVVRRKNDGQITVKNGE